MPPLQFEYLESLLEDDPEQKFVATHEVFIDPHPFDLEMEYIF